MITMEPRQALDQTIKTFGLKAADIAKKAGMGSNELSRYRRGHNDILASRVFDIIRALPLQAQMYFWVLISGSEGEQDTQQAA
jgi:transcriptional regulator with XRE-family HTH domain